MLSLIKAQNLTALQYLSLHRQRAALRGEPELRLSPRR
jgi:hypothetical protein